MFLDNCVVQQDNDDEWIDPTRQSLYVEYMDKVAKELHSEAIIGKTYKLVDRGDNHHGMMMHVGGVYELKKINDDDKAKYTFTSDYGKDDLYKVSKETFDKHMVLCTYEEACTVQLKLK